MAAPKAPVLDRAGKASRDLSLDAGIFGARVKPHLVHEAVRAELNAARSGTRAAKSRGLVSGGRAKPWRQKGTGRARAGTTRAPQFTGGGVAFPPSPRSFEVKVNRKARYAAFRSALTSHAAAGTLGVLGGGAFDGGPSTKAAVSLLAGWAVELPLVIVVDEGEETVAKSFRNLERVAIVTPGELDVAAIVWARSLLVSEAALPLVERRAGLSRETRPEAAG